MKLKDEIQNAFHELTYPGDWCLRDSNEGNEPYLVEQEFAGKTDWTQLDREFLDQAPGGYSSALAFFSDEAFRFYIAAYMIADIEGGLSAVNPAFYLTHGLTNKNKNKKVNERRYGSRTWYEASSHRFSTFDKMQCSAIIKYLEWKSSRDSYDAPDIKQAINNFWRSRAET